MSETYNGWKNRQTWNVSLWIQNDENLYDEACSFMRTYKGRSPYRDFIKSIGLENTRTDDNIAYISTRLDYKALNGMMRELVA